jgi:hypothetical protein
MRRRCVFALVLLAGFGCALGDRAQWEEVWKDLRGDNMQMKMHYDDGPEGMSDRPFLTKPRD